MSKDLPAEFLPALPTNRVRTSLGVKDARVEAMMAAMQQRPSSVRRDSGSQTQITSVDLSRTANSSGRPPSIERPMSIRSSISDARPRLELATPVEESQRPMSIRSIPTDRSRGGSANFSDDGIQSVSTTFSRTNRVVPEELPMAIAMAEAEAPPAKPQKPANMLPPFARSFNNTAGNRDTLTLSDEELARRLHEQLNGMPQEDGQIVTAEIVQQEVMDRRQAELVLDQEIASLENAVMARQLEGGTGLMNDAGQAEDDAFRAALAMNDKLDYMRPESHKPIFSAIVFTITTITLCVEIGINGGVEPFSVNPTFGPTAAVLLEMGAKRADLILAGQWWRLFAPIILHAGILHLLFNMLGLWNIGVPMEREFGSLRIAAIYICSGCFGVLLSCLFAPKLTSVGASGAIFGLFGAAWADLIQNWSLYKGAQIKMLLQLAIMTAFNLVLGLMPFLDQYAHIGGLTAGCVLGLGVLVQTRYYYSGMKKRKRVYQLVLMALSFLGLPALFIAGYTYFFIHGPANCSWCSVISCVPMPPGVPYSQRWWSCDQCSQSGVQGTLDANNTLTFACPNNASIIETQNFPPSTLVNQEVLIETCLALCLGQT